MLVRHETLEEMAGRGPAARVQESRGTETSCFGVVDGELWFPTAPLRILGQSEES